MFKYVKIVENNGQNTRNSKYVYNVDRRVFTFGHFLFCEKVTVLRLID